MNPEVVGLPSKRQSAMDWAKAVGTNIDIVAKVESIKFNVMPESMGVEWGQGCQGFKGKPRKTFWTEMLSKVE